MWFTRDNYFSYRIPMDTMAWMHLSALSCGNMSLVCPVTQPSNIIYAEYVMEQKKRAAAEFSAEVY